MSYFKSKKHFNVQMQYNVQLQNQQWDLQQLTIYPLKQKIQILACLHENAKNIQKTG